MRVSVMVICFCLFLSYYVTSQLPACSLVEFGRVRFYFYIVRRRWPSKHCIERMR